jgi:hypothetical protein
MIDPGQASRNALWELYKLSASDSCSSNRVDIYQSDCSTPIPVDTPSAYLTSGNGPGQDVHIEGTAETPTVWSRSDRLSMHELCFKASAKDSSVL